LLSFRGFDTPSLPAQGEQRRSSFFNIRRDIGAASEASCEATIWEKPVVARSNVSAVLINRIRICTPPGPIQR
jgi:hypothetical protein